MSSAYCRQRGVRGGGGADGRGAHGAVAGALPARRAAGRAAARAAPRHRQAHAAAVIATDLFYSSTYLKLHLAR